MKNKIHYLGIAVILVGFFLFFSSTEQKKGHLVYSKKRTINNKVFKDSIILNAGSNYVIAFSAEHETGAGFEEWPTATATIRITNSNLKELFSARIDVTEHRETGGLRRAQDYREYKHSAETDEPLYIETKLIKGDKMEVDIYENLSDIGNILPGLGIIVALIGVFIFLKYRKRRNE